MEAIHVILSVHVHSSHRLLGDTFVCPDVDTRVDEGILRIGDGTIGEDFVVVWDLGGDRVAGERQARMERCQNRLSVFASYLVK